MGDCDCELREIIRPVLQEGIVIDGNEDGEGIEPDSPASKGLNRQRIIERYSTWKLRDNVAEFASVFADALPLDGKTSDSV